MIFFYIRIKFYSTTIETSNARISITVGGLCLHEQADHLAKNTSHREKPIGGISHRNGYLK